VWSWLSLKTTFTSISLQSMEITGGHQHNPVCIIFFVFQLTSIVPSLWLCISFLFHLSLRITGNTVTLECIKARTFLVADTRIIHSKHMGTVPRTVNMQYLAIERHLLKWGSRYKPSSFPSKLQNGLTRSANGGHGVVCGCYRVDRVGRWSSILVDLGAIWSKDRHSVE
jgi:hypothetical protein